MCEQTEINYLDGEVVWVKLGACWWPGEVTSFHNLPEDIQVEFRKKPLIAAVKFFQEDTYEFVKNLHQIYKYNCTQKDEFIKKGLDKYRTKSKDGSSYMDKFPGDVEMAEKLTGGDPDILMSEKFSPEEKPDISALFGEKKIPKRKRERDEMHRRSDGSMVARKITHPRFLRESDHEIRIRQQPSTLPSPLKTPTSDSPQFSCHLCNFTSSRVNVIICHTKSHRSGSFESPVSRPRIATHSSSKSASRASGGDTQKRKYVRKQKSQPSKMRPDRESEPVKRKYTKQIDKTPTTTKKKKTDPELREKLLADWDDESDEDMDLDLNKTNESSLSSKNFDTSINRSESGDEEDKPEDPEDDGTEIIKASEKLLRDTEKITALLGGESPSRASRNSNNKHDDFNSDDSSLKAQKSPSPKKHKKSVSQEEGKSNATNEKDDKQSRFSCFDFDEEDLPEPTITPVRKIPRVFGEKNTSVKKEILKKFTMSQALKNDKDEEEIEKTQDDFYRKKEEDEEKLEAKQHTPEDSLTEDHENSTKEEEEDRQSEIEKTKAEAPVTEEQDKENSKSNATTTETEVEIVEIFEVEGEKETHEGSEEPVEKMETDENETECAEKSNEATEHPTSSEVESPKEETTEDKLEIPAFKSTTTEFQSEKDEAMSEPATTETEDETVSELAESLQGHSENSDTDGTLTQGSWDASSKTKRSKDAKTSEEKALPRRRGRPRKSLVASEQASGNGEDSSKPDFALEAKSSPASRGSERKTSESDSDRSYTGRRRKPNKRYLHSEIYARSPDNRASRTDESQSENEEKAQTPKGRSRRGRKPAVLLETPKKEMEGSKEQEFEFSSPVVEATEHQEEAGASNTSDFPEKARETREKIVEEPETASNSMDSGRKLDSIGSPVNITRFLCGDVDPAPKPEEKEEHRSEERNENAVASGDPELPEEAKSEAKFDKLPPKKSQIKKFELSQIDLLEACSVQVAAESAAEMGMEYGGCAESEMEVCTVVEAAVGASKEEKEEKVEKVETIEKLEVEASPVLEESVESLKEKPVDNVVEELVQNSTIQTVEAELARITSEENAEQSEKVEKNVVASEKEEVEKVVEESKVEQSLKDDTESVQKVVESEEAPQSLKSEAKLEETTVSTESTEESSDNPSNSFQEEFLRTLQAEKEEDMVPEGEPAPKKPDDTVAQISVENATTDSKSASEVPLEVAEATVERQAATPMLNAMTEFEGVEILVQENIEVDVKAEEASAATRVELSSNLTETEAKIEEANALSLDLQKIEDTLTDSVSTPSPTPDICVPVKKREKPRIIENVTLKEPMQILKSKLLEKLPTKSTTKHKLETDASKRGEPKGAPRAKMMKMESASPGKRSPGKAQFTVSKKLQALKAEEIAEKEQEKLAQVSQTISHPADGEKFIQQSSQSLADMELDINSMPFVLSEDVLTPESIEQMPVVISSIIPSSSSSGSTVPASPSASSSSSSAPTSLSLTPTSQLIVANQLQTVTSENPTPGKKKSGTPAILKSKGKAKPTITSIKTLVPPLTGGVKGIKFQNPQAAGKALPLISQKSTPGKYVIVQTGGQQMRYSVQGKPGMSQKIAIPAGKAAGNPQIVQQGGKVVILTSAQSGQTKMLPLNISKSLSGKVQKIVNNKGQLYTPISPQGIVSSKTMIAPKSEAGSATTSKLSSGQKIINTQGIITSKGVLTPISTSKTGGLLSTLSQGIITKGGLYTPISSAQLAGKTIISGKTIVNKAGTIISSLGGQTLGTSKAVLAPISHTITGKTIINAQGIVTPKGTVLTPITGQQVKALAAKSPGKGAKVHYQAVQQKLQLPMLQKCQKIPVSSPVSQTRLAQGVKTPGASGTIVFQNAVLPGQKVTTPTGKKIVRQVVGVRSPQAVVSQSGSPSQQLLQQKGKTVTTTPTVQRVVVPRARQTKAQQKIVVQKLQDSSATGTSPLMNIQSKASTSCVGGIAKTPQKASPTVHRASTKGNRHAQQQKHLLNVALSSIAPSPGGNDSSTAHTAIRQTQAQPPPLAPLAPPELTTPPDHHETGTTLSNEQKTNESLNLKDTMKLEPPREVPGESPKVEENKVPSQPQIMALPTESSDGTQTYVLVTIDEQGQIQPLDNNTLMSLEGTTQSPDGTRTLYIDPSSLGEVGALDNIVLQFDNGALPALQSPATVGEASTQSSVPSTDNFSTSEIIQTSNQDILAAALANTDFQQEIGLPEHTTSSVMTSGLTQTSLINQTILQSTIIPPTEPISSPSVLETSLTLNQPIMTPLEVPTSMPIQIEPTPPAVASTIPTSLELPITITDPNISYIATTASAPETHIRIPGNSMPDIGEIMESPATQEMPVSTQYLVIPSLDENMTIQARAIETQSDASGASVAYSVSIPESAVLEAPQVQRTPSMPIIDDGFAENTEQTFETTTGADCVTGKVEQEARGERSEEVGSVNVETGETEAPRVPEESTEHKENVVQQEESVLVQSEESTVDMPAICQEVSAPCVEEKQEEKMEVDEHSQEKSVDLGGSAEESNVGSEVQTEMQQVEIVQKESTSSGEDPGVAEAVEEQQRTMESLVGEETLKKEEVAVRESSCAGTEASEGGSGVREAGLESEEMVTEPTPKLEVFSEGGCANVDVAQSVEASSQGERVEECVVENAAVVEPMEEESVVVAGTSQEEAPSQSFEQFGSGTTGEDSAQSRLPESIESPTQSAEKPENSGEPSQSIVYDPMEIDENTVSGEPPTQSFEDAKQNEAQSYDNSRSTEVNANAPTQSFNEIMQCAEEEGSSTAGPTMDDPSFPTQSYEVGKMENLLENLEREEGAASQEGNIPSQSNDRIGTSSTAAVVASTNNNIGLNEDETASSSYMPETPENQERDQDQESAISTSSYEIPPCEELNIASSSVIPDTSANSGEHPPIHDNGVPEIPTSSYSLNPDSSSTSHVDTLPSSSYEDQVIVEQNVSTSYEVPISMPGLEETSSQNFVTESTDHGSEASRYYPRHQEVSASYYETVQQESSNSRLEAADQPQEEVTPGYYETQEQDIGSEASQSYFRQNPRYSNVESVVSPSYYEAAPEGEASQSYYSHEIVEATTEQPSGNVEASQSFYQEAGPEEMRLRQQGEPTSTYTERYPNVDYALSDSPIERHDLVESSVPATRPTDR